MKYTLVQVDLEKKLCEIEAGPGVKLAATVSKRGSLVEVREDGRRYTFLASAPLADGSSFVATQFGSMKVALLRGEAAEGAGTAGSKQKVLKSSMPGKVVKLLCKVGDQVQKDQPLLIIEAMKMENEIRSPITGIVVEMGVDTGKKVDTGAMLVKIEAQES